MILYMIYDIWRLIAGNIIELNDGVSSLPSLDYQGLLMSVPTQNSQTARRGYSSLSGSNHALGSILLGLTPASKDKRI